MPSTEEIIRKVATITRQRGYRGAMKRAAAELGMKTETLRSRLNRSPEWYGVREGLRPPPAPTPEEVRAEYARQLGQGARGAARRTASALGVAESTVYEGIRAGSWSPRLTRTEHGYSCTLPSGAVVLVVRKFYRGAMWWRLQRTQLAPAAVLDAARTDVGPPGPEYRTLREVRDHLVNLHYDDVNVVNARRST